MTHLTIGRNYRVEGVFPGAFVGRCVDILTVGHERSVQLLIVDTLRPRPRVRDKCAFPECVRYDGHDGNHEFPRIRKGNFIDLPIYGVRFVELPKAAA